MFYTIWLIANFFVEIVGEFDEVPAPIFYIGHILVVILNIVCIYFNFIDIRVIGLFCKDGLMDAGRIFFALLCSLISIVKILGLEE